MVFVKLKNIFIAKMTRTTKLFWSFKKKTPVFFLLLYIIHQPSATKISLFYLQTDWEVVVGPTQTWVSVSGLVGWIKFKLLKGSNTEVLQLIEDNPGSDYTQTNFQETFQADFLA